MLDPLEVENYSRDALGFNRAFGQAAHLLEKRADVIVRPISVIEVVELVKFANDYRIPLSPYGGGSGVMGSLVPVNGGIIVDLAKLNRILDISHTNRSTTVESGIVLQELSSSLETKGLMLGHDPWSVPIATVGGAISTNGIGYRASKVGSMGDQVLGLEVVLPSGHILKTPNIPQVSSGPNLNHMFIGSEGVLGIITKATLRIFRQPEERLFATFRFTTFEDGFNALVELFTIDLHPAVIDLTEDFEGIHLYLILEGSKDEVVAQKRRAEQICQTFNGTHTGPTEAIIYWDTRYQVAETYKAHIRKVFAGEERRDPGRCFDYLHVALPTSKILEYRRFCEDIFKNHDIRVPEYSVWTEPELFSMVLVPGTNTNLADMPKVIDTVLMMAQDMGGIMEYCHGVGIKLSHLLPREMGVGIEVVRSIKKALDPYNIMNPGKLALDI